MCGIIGIVGRIDDVGDLPAGLERLDYSGYDSAGLAVVQDRGIAARRAKGPLRALREVSTASPVRGTIGIAHTCWTTHGVPCERNAHPYCTGRVAVVHNGIVENSGGPRARIAVAGRSFASDSGTEVRLVIDYEACVGRAMICQRWGSGSRVSHGHRRTRGAPNDGAGGIAVGHAAPILSLTSN